jgi:hypothetical protein
VKRRLISADARLFRLFDAATRATQFRSFSKWAVFVLAGKARAELQAVGLDWSNTQGRPLDVSRKGDRNVMDLSGIRAARERVLKKPKRRQRK